MRGSSVGEHTADEVVRSREVAGSSPAPAAKTQFGRIANQIDKMIAEREDPEPAVDESPLCSVCESPMREKSGKWACVDDSCAKYGMEQKVRR